MNAKKFGEGDRLTLERAKDEAISHMLSKELSKAKKIINKSIRIAADSFGKKDCLTLKLYELYGVCLRAEREYERSLKTFEKVCKIREKVSGFGNRNSIICNKLRA